MVVYKTCLRGVVITACLTLSLLPMCLFLGPTGCSLKQGLPSIQDEAARLHLFRPLTEPGAFLISPAEAESLALKMSTGYHEPAARQNLHFAVSQSLAYTASKTSSTNAVNLPGLQLTYGELTASLIRLQEVLPRLENFPGILTREFDWYRIGPDFGITGYFEPTLKASRRQSAAYPYPLYKVPGELKTGVPYYTRSQIDRQGALAGRSLEIAWVESEMDAFFLHVQGSGRLEFEDGSTSHVLYGNKNNRSYVSLGRVMREKGLLDSDNVSMQSIRDYLKRHPDQMAELFDANPSYVFFREARHGPVGSMGRTLTPSVSVASDRSVLPSGSLTFLITPLPDSQGRPAKAFYGLTLPQDTGGAIKGRRLDLFCGPGAEAEHTAGYLDYQGAVYVLVKKIR